MRLNRVSALPAIVLMIAGLTLQAQAGQIQTVFVIAMENHNWMQPSSVTSPQQILGNPAAPYINSLVTPGNPNAQMVSYASNYLERWSWHTPLRAQLSMGRRWL